MYFHKTSHRVTAIECTLGATENVNSFDIIEIEIESRFVEIRNIVYIHTYRRRIDTRTDATDIHGRGEA